MSHPSPAPIELEPREVDALAATSVTISDASGKPRLAAISLSWDGAEVGDARGLEYELRVVGETDLASRGSVADPEVGTVVFSEGVIPGADMEVRAKLLVSRQAVWSDWVPVTVTGTRLEVDAPFVMSNTTRRDEIGVMHVDWEIRLSCQTGVADLFELQRKVSETEWETVGFNETGVFSVLDIYVVNFRARCRNLFGVWGDWTPEQGGVVLPQAPTAEDYAFANLDVEGSLRMGDNVRAYFGDEDDLYIRYDNYNGEIRLEEGKGNLLTRADAHLCQVNDGSGGLWTTWSAGTGGAMNLNFQGTQKAYTTSYGLNVLGRIALTAYTAGQDRTRIHFNRNDPNEGLAWIGIPDWQPDAYYFYMPTSAGVQAAAARYRNDEWTFWANSVEALRIQSSRLLMKVPPKLPDYTVASAPSAAVLGDGAKIWLTDASGGPTEANSLGGAWVRVRDNYPVA